MEVLRDLAKDGNTEILASLSRRKYNELCNFAYMMNNPEVLSQLVRHHPDLTLDFVKDFILKSTHDNMSGVWSAIFEKMDIASVIFGISTSHTEKYYKDFRQALLRYRDPDGDFHGWKWLIFIWHDCIPSYNYDFLFDAAKDPELRPYVVNMLKYLPIGIREILSKKHLEVYDSLTE